MKFYEPGMRVLFDSERQKVTVTFRGRRIELPGMFLNEAEARIAGEAYCRAHGWKDKLSTPNAAKSLLPHRRSTAAPLF